MIPSATVVRLAVRLLGVVPATPVRWIARAAGNIAYVFARERRATLLENQRYLSPDATPREQRRRARRTLANLLDAAVDLWRLPTMSRASLDAILRIEGREHLDAASAMGKGVVIVTAHLGPYELGGAWLAHAGYPVHAMVEALDPETNAALALYRESTGMKLIARSSGMRTSLRLLRDSQLLLLVADRVIGEGSEGLEVPFGAGRRAVPTGPAALAIATGAPIVVGTITRRSGSAPRYLVQLEPPILAAGPDGALLDREALTRIVSERMSAAVEAHSDQWFVFQPQWIRRDVASRD